MAGHYEMTQLPQIGDAHLPVSLVTCLEWIGPGALDFNPEARCQWERGFSDWYRENLDDSGS